MNTTDSLGKQHNADQIKGEIIIIIMKSTKCR